MMMTCIGSEGRKQERWKREKEAAAVTGWRREINWNRRSVVCARLPLLSSRDERIDNWIWEREIDEQCVRAVAVSIAFFVLPLA